MRDFTEADITDADLVEADFMIDYLQHKYRDQLTARVSMRMIETIEADAEFNRRFSKHMVKEFITYMKGRISGEIRNHACAALRARSNRSH